MHSLPRLTWLAPATALVVLTVIVPVPAILVDVLVLGTVVAAIAADRTPARRGLRAATFAMEAALAVAVARVVAVRAVGDERQGDARGVVAAVGDLLTGGSALVGSFVAFVFVAALAVAAVRTRTARLRVAAAAVALVVAGSATALAPHFGASDTDALRAFARLGVGTALLFSVPVLVALRSRATRSPAT